ncbi:hypothetical protein NG54_09620 [Heyndrickxia ginsengihumi]|uniref:Uncharacterized protein n=1 Tax=Heyndrickxia ginsengihumi TaxID=363870 RepID=A0A0A6VFI0_9BACI|nr:hypothetical protein NG54_09620 [Heyndrickxia ginsengihumi]
MIVMSNDVKIVTDRYVLMILFDAKNKVHQGSNKALMRSIFAAKFNPPYLMRFIWNAIKITI